MSDICATILTYNRCHTLADNLSAFLQSGADDIVFVDNCSTDGTSKLLAKVAGDNDNVSVRRNRMNLGYSRSFIKSFIDCDSDYVVYLSDEDCPTPELIGLYKRILADFPGLGAVALANPYPKVWSIPELDKSDIVSKSRDFVAFKPGLYAAHLAAYQSTYIGGLMLRCDSVPNFGNFILERGSYPQRLLAMDAAYNAGLALVKRGGLGQFPNFHASKKQETMTRRQGDWGIDEWFSIARIFDDFYPTDKLSPAALGDIREKQTRYALTRFAFYFETVSKRGYEPTIKFMRAVKHTSEIMGLASTWIFNFNWMKGRFTPEQMQLFHRCCRVLDTERAVPLWRSKCLHDHTKFGVAVSEVQCTPLGDPIKESELS